MLIFVLRYFFVYWIMVGSSASEETLSRDLNLDVKYVPIASCILRCMQQVRVTYYDSESTDRQNNLHDQNCIDHCLDENEAISLHSEKCHHVDIPYRMTLVCRDDRSLTFRINRINNVERSEEEEDGVRSIKIESLEDEKTHENEHISLKRENEDHNVFKVTGKMNYTKHTQIQVTTTNPNADNVQMINQRMEVFYVVTVQSDINVRSNRTFNDSLFTINALENSTTYTISAVSVFSELEYAIVARDQEFTTLQRDYTPGLVGEIKRKRFLPDELNEMHVMAEITWQPTKDKTCHYNILYYDENQGSDMTSMEIRNPRQLYTYTLENLSFSAAYKVGICAKNTYNATKESEMKWLTVHVPSCAALYNYNFSICPPFTPKGLNVDCKYVRDNTYSLHVTWKKTDFPISHYNLMIVDHVYGGQNDPFSVDASANKFFIPEIKLNGTLFDVHLIAFTPGGNSSAILQNRQCMLSDKTDFIMIVIYILILILCFVITMSLLIFVHRYRAKVKRHTERCKYFEDLEKKLPIKEKDTFDFPKKNLLSSPENLAQLQLDLDEKIFLNDTMEIDRNDVTLYEVLGEGAFGLVRRGTYNDGKSGSREVAVKMLKDRPSIDDVRAFRREIEVMKSVERHPNIVGIIGHCTQRYNEMLLLTEYCSFGNLLEFLRDEWKYLYDLNFKCNSVSSASMKRMSSRLHTYRTRRQERCGRPSLTLTHRGICSDNSSNHVTNSSSNDHNSSYAVCKINNADGVGNGFDSSIIERLKFIYKKKNHNSLHLKCITEQTTRIYPPLDDISATTSIAMINDVAPPAIPTLPSPPPPPPSNFIAVAAANKSYGYDEFCNINACKYQHMDFDIDVKDSKLIENVLNGSDVGQASADGESNREQQQQHHYKGQHCPHLTHNDDYQQQQTVPMKRNEKERTSSKFAAPIENKSYFKILPEIFSEASLRKFQWQKRHERNAERNRRLVAWEQTLSNVSTSTITTTVGSRAQTTAEKGCNDTLSASVRREPLSTADLLDIARQVAVGMEFLAKNKVVHRDLAARNVLVAPDRTIKIADFGLSRDIYQENVYKRTGNGKLPIKWLALESMTHQVYTTQSDVWSYGILLYEIVTLGGTPYPMIPTNRLLHLLKNGYRMGKPKNCGNEFYNLMYACWNVNPGDRPSFSAIIKILDEFLADEPERKTENVLGVPNMECVEHCQHLERPFQKSYHQRLYAEHQFQEHPQSTFIDDAEMDATNMDDSYMKPLY